MVQLRQQGGGIKALHQISFWNLSSSLHISEFYIKWYYKNSESNKIQAHLALFVFSLEWNQIPSSAPSYWSSQVVQKKALSRVNELKKTKYFLCGQLSLQIC